MKTLVALALIAILTESGLSLAASINDRQQNQRERISQGARPGEVTRHEARQITKQQKRIASREAQFKSDGVYTKRERASIQHSLNKSSANIYRKKHNDTNRL